MVFELIMKWNVRHYRRMLDMTLESSLKTTQCAVFAVPVVFSPFSISLFSNYHLLIDKTLMATFSLEATSHIC